MITYKQTKPNPGLFVVVEGIDGSGKTTLIEQLRKRLDEHWIDVEVFRQPGGNKLSEAIRGLVKDPQYKDEINPDIEYLLFNAAIASTDIEIEPFLKTGWVVIVDRHIGSSYAYQGQLINEINSKTIRKPDLIIYCDVDTDIALARSKGRGENCRIEQEQSDQYELIKSRYHEYLEHHSDILMCIDTNEFDEYYEKRLESIEYMIRAAHDEKNSMIPTELTNYTQSVYGYGSLQTSAINIDDEVWTTIEFKPNEIGVIHNRKYDVAVVFESCVPHKLSDTIDLLLPFDCGRIIRSVDILTNVKETEEYIHYIKNTLLGLVEITECCEF